MTKTSRFALHKLRGKLPTKPGKHPDGGGLWLRVGPNGSQGWIFRYQREGKERNLGLGSMPLVTLKDAREKAAELRAQLAKGTWPEGQRSSAPAQVETAGLTFEQAAYECIKYYEADWSIRNHQRWVSTLRRYAFPALGRKLVADITREDVVAVLLTDDLWTTKPETADRTLLYITKVIDLADGEEGRERVNPATLAKKPGREGNTLPKRKKRETQSRPMVDPEMMPEFMAKLRQIDKPVARALEFQILTGARPGEIRTLEWDEIAGDVWTVPAAKYKTDKDHSTPLTEAAKTCLPDRSDGLVFPGLHENSAVNLLTAMGYVGKNKATAHGFRASLSTWAGDHGIKPWVTEAVLGHVLGDVEGRYNRAERLALKLDMLDQWAEFLAGAGEGQEAA